MPRKFGIGSGRGVLRRVRSFFSNVGGGVLTFFNRGLANLALIDPHVVNPPSKFTPKVFKKPVSRDGQYCYFLPRQSFNRLMHISNSGDCLEVGGVSISMQRLEGVIVNGCQIFLLTTNMQSEALNALGMTADQGKNKRLAIAVTVSGAIVDLSSSERGDRISQVFYNTPMSSSVTHIRNNETGQTSYLLTFLALPFNVAAFTCKFLFMIPHGLTWYSAKLFGLGADRLERGVKELIAAKERGTTAPRGRIMSPGFLAVCGLVLRFLERAFSFIAYCIGSLRLFSSTMLRSVPILMSAAYNKSGDELKFAMGCLGHMFMEVGRNFRDNFVETGRDDDKAPGKGESGGGFARSPSDGEFVETQPLVSRREGLGGAAQQQYYGSDDELNVRGGVGEHAPTPGYDGFGFVSLNREDLNAVGSQGDALVSGGMTMSYGTDVTQQQGHQQSAVPSVGRGGGSARSLAK